MVVFDPLKRVIRHAQFLALIKIRRSFHEVEDRGDGLGALRAVVPEPGDRPRLVMVVEIDRVPGVPVELLLPFAEISL